MSITPQVIKDQEFQVKFRGYDTIEVKAYLELLAENFFELHEESNKKDEELELLRMEREELTAKSGESESDKGELKKKSAELDELNKIMKAAQTREEELKAKIAGLQSQLEEEREKATGLEREKGSLEGEINQRQKKLDELEKAEVDFKDTLGAAQKFANDMRRSAEEESSRIMQQAQAEVEEFRRNAEEQLAHLPVEIEALESKKEQVKEEVRGLLNSYLDMLKDPAAEEEDSELFQKIDLE